MSEEKEARAEGTKDPKQGKEKKSVARVSKGARIQIAHKLDRRALSLIEYDRSQTHTHTHSFSLRDNKKGTVSR